MAIILFHIAGAENISSLCGHSIEDNPNPTALVCPVIRVFNVLIYAAGGIFICMVIYGGIKLSMSLGDPKGYEGAQLTWFWAVVGLAVVIGFWVILLVLDNIFGLGIGPGGPQGIFQRIVDQFSALLIAIGVNGVTP